MQSGDGIFDLSPTVTANFKTAGSSIPILQVDDIYARPDAVRDMALALPFSPPAYPYPGKIAVPPVTDSLRMIGEWVLRVVNQHYLPRIPPIAKDGQRITSFRQLFSDFAIIDVHPDELSPTQRLPHVDPVPVFGLIYLNREERGGTLFFDKVAGVGRDDSGTGYFTSGNREFQLRGEIEAAFNRLVIYPGFVPHSAQIAGDWIEGEARLTSPRLTQRFVFFP